MNAQADQLNKVFSNALMPVANVIVPKVTARTSELTKVVGENAEGIRNVGYSVAEVVDTIGEFTTAIAKLIAQSGSLITSQKSKKYDIIDLYRKDYSIKNFNDLLEKEMQRMPLPEKRLLETSERQYAAYLKSLRSTYDEIKKIQKYANKTEKESDDSQKIDPGELAESLERARNYADELSRSSLSALYSAKRQQIEHQHNEEIEREQKESDQRIKRLTDETASILYERTHSAYEKQIYDIERWKERSIEAIKDKSNATEEAAAITANALAKEARAFEQEMDRIRGKVQSLKEKIFEQEHSQYDIDVMRAQKERAGYYKEGVHRSEDIEHWYRNEISKLSQRASEDESYQQTPSLPEKVPVVEYFYGDIEKSTNYQMAQYGNLEDTARNAAL